MNGITYFKLMNPKYGDDRTKGCALTGAEIDSNFNFLRAYDIESIEIVSPSTLVLKRVDGQELTVDLQNDEVRRVVAELETKTEQLEQQTSAMSTTVDENAAAVADHSQRIGILEAVTTDISSTLADHSTAITDCGDRVVVLENQTSAMSDVLAAQTTAVTNHGNRIQILESGVYELSGKSVDYEERISELESKVSELQTTCQNLSANLILVMDAINNLRLGEVRGISLEDKVKFIVAKKLLSGNEESVSFDFGPNSEIEIPETIVFRFGEHAKFIANIPGQNQS